MTAPLVPADRWRPRSRPTPRRPAGAPAHRHPRGGRRRPPRRAIRFAGSGRRSAERLAPPRPWPPRILDATGPGRRDRPALPPGLRRSRRWPRHGARRWHPGRGPRRLVSGEPHAAPARWPAPGLPTAATDGGRSARRHRASPRRPPRPGTPQARARRRPAPRPPARRPGRSSPRRAARPARHPRATRRAHGRTPPAADPAPATRPAASPRRRAAARSRHGRTREGPADCHWSRR